jgi:ABC-2 type transport system ATP-binding protein
MSTLPPIPRRDDATSAGSWQQRLRDKARAAAVRIDDLSKVYTPPSGGGRIVAVDHVTVEIAAGEMFAVVGPTGAGKSTLLKLVCGLIDPTAGRVTINNLEVERDRDEVQPGIGYVGSPFGLYDDLLVWEVLDYFARAHGSPLGPSSARVEALLELLGLTPLRDAPVCDLPVGARVRVGVARALVHDPPLLVLDEPMLGLDARERAWLKSVLAGQHAQGKTILIASPTMTDLEVPCNTVRLLEYGRLLPAGRAEQVLQEAGSSGQIP